MKSVLRGGKSRQQRRRYRDSHNCTHFICLSLFKQRASTKVTETVRSVDVVAWRVMWGRMECVRPGEEVSLLSWSAFSAKMFSQVNGPELFSNAFYKGRMHEHDWAPCASGWDEVLNMSYWRRLATIKPSGFDFEEWQFKIENVIQFLDSIIINSVIWTSDIPIVGKSILVKCSCAPKLKSTHPLQNQSNIYYYL